MLVPDPTTRVRSDSTTDRRAVLSRRPADHRRRVLGMLPAAFPAPRARRPARRHRLDAARRVRAGVRLHRRRGTAERHLRARRVPPPGRFRRAVPWRHPRRPAPCPNSFLPEYGPRQFEVTVAPATGLRAADEAVIVREMARAVAWRLGHRAIFAPMLDAEGIGNGTHIHFSLVDDGGRAGDARSGRPARAVGGGRAFRRRRAAPHAGAGGDHRAVGRLLLPADAEPLGADLGQSRRARPRRGAARLPGVRGGRAPRGGSRSSTSNTASPTPPPRRTWRSARWCMRAWTACGDKRALPRLPAQRFLGR